MKKIKFILNTKDIEVSLNPGISALDFIRNDQNLKGTKAGCREGDCGACAILLGEKINEKMIYKTVASCLLPLNDFNNRHIVTIEGLNKEKLTPLQEFIVHEGATQCGFCTPGFVISFTGFLLSAKIFNIENAIRFIDGNICRCTGYSSIFRVAEKLCGSFSDIIKSNDRIADLIKKRILPEYFSEIPKRLQQTEEEMPETGDENSIILSGGTDLYVQIPDELPEKKINFISYNSQLKKIEEDEKYYYIGACATIEEIRETKFFNEIFNPFLDLISSTLMRNRATTGGNIINASPIGDFSIILLALNSELKLSSNGNSRIIFLKNFFKSYKKMDINPGEVIEWFRFEKFTGNTFFNFEKVSKRIHLDIASVNSAMKIKIENENISFIDISFGGVAPIPLYLKKTSEFLLNENLESEILSSAAEIFEDEISPISDVRGTKEYKSALAKRLFYTHFIKLFPDKFNLEDLYE